ncbi:hypothetical protein J6590_103269 [Homalodisca vitripennis]|nr:hypothetical protein J6590_103269 [Homalodisca vitripennis]
MQLKESHLEAADVRLHLCVFGCQQDILLRIFSYGGYSSYGKQSKTKTGREKKHRSGARTAACPSAFQTASGTSIQKEISK